MGTLRHQLLLGPSTSWNYLQVNGGNLGNAEQIYLRREDKKNDTPNEHHHVWFVFKA